MTADADCFTQQPSGNLSDEQCAGLSPALTLLFSVTCALAVANVYFAQPLLASMAESLGVAKNILASRLKALVEVGVFDVRPASDGSAYKEYVLTEKGREIFPVVVSLRQWGERFLFEPGETRSVLLDNTSGQALMPMDVRSSSGQKLGPADCHRVRLIADNPTRD